MNYKRLSLAVIMVLLLSNSGYSASIYKCTKKDKTVVFTDGKCPADASVAIIHKETEQEIQHRMQAEKIANLKRLVANNQVAAAKEYALKNNLEQVYNEQLADYLTQQADAEKQAVERDKQQQLTIQQQTLTLQQQQLELQKQQIAIDKARAEQQKQPNYNQPYYIYPGFRRTRHNHCKSLYCPPSWPNPSPLTPGGMNPPPSIAPKMNPPSSVSVPMRIKPPSSISVPMKIKPPPK